MIEQYWLVQKSRVMAGYKDESNIRKEVDKTNHLKITVKYETINVLKTHTGEYYGILACI